MSSDVAIRVRDLSKVYFLYGRPEDRLKQTIVPRLERLVGRAPTQYYRRFAALDRVSFEVGRGETVGIIGRNGSGKSTLLQLICGTLQPSTGAVEVNGRVAALLELGAGFNPDFTGRENAYLNGAILGLTRGELDARFDDIAAFADIGQFMDQPVKTYSSGMYVRLAFAVAVCVDPDILIVDEALAVGDEAFQRKCYARIEQIQERGATILFVSHAAQTIVQLCSRALLIDGGELLLDGRPKMVIGQYQRLVHATAGAGGEVRRQLRTAVASETLSPSADTNERLGTMEYLDRSLKSTPLVLHAGNGVEIRNPKITDMSGDEINNIVMGRKYIFEYTVEFSREVLEVGFGYALRTVSGLTLAGSQTFLSRRDRLPRVPANARVRVKFIFSSILKPGTYFLGAGVKGVVHDCPTHLHSIEDACAFRVMAEDELISWGLCDIGASADITLFFDERFGHSHPPNMLRTPAGS